MENNQTPPAHTPTPWYYGHSENPDVYRNAPHWLVLSDPVESTGEAIADVETGPGPETAEANAAFIVRACNSHHALVTAARHALDYVRRVGCGSDQPERIEELESALAAADGSAT